MFTHTNDEHSEELNGEQNDDQNCEDLVEKVLLGNESIKEN